jgi:glycosyltransferase involved in cell wall biosynthesis
MVTQVSVDCRQDAGVTGVRMHTVLYPTVSLTTGGAEQQLLELVRGLDKRRFRPIVAALHRGGTREDEFREIPGVEVVYLDRGGKLDFSPIWKLVALLRRRDVDVVQPFVSPALFFGLLAGVLAGTPVKIATERGGARNDPGRGGRLYLHATSQLLPFVDVAVANSEAGRQLLHREGMPVSKTLLIRNGVNPVRLRPASEAVAAHRRRLRADDAAPVVGILATLKPAKGQDTFLHAAAEVAKARPDARFAIVGDGPLRADLEGLARQLGIWDRVVFFGLQQRVADFIELFDVLVSASRDNEGHSNSILEAMALGVPVVATDVGGSRELVDGGRNGRLVRVDDHRMLAAAVLAVLDQPDTTKAMISRARAMVADNFSVERMVSDYTALYEQTLSRARSRTSRDRRRRTPGGVFATVQGRR